MKNFRSEAFLLKFWLKFWLFCVVEALMVLFSVWAAVHDNNFKDLILLLLCLPLAAPFLISLGTTVQKFVEGYDDF